MSDQNHWERGQSSESIFTSRRGIVLVGFLLIAGYFLVTEHSAHLALAVPYLPFLLLAACPLMHVFMHGGHGHHQHHDQDAAGSGPKPMEGHAP